ncbi:MAG TPA: chemotaxis protein CheW, partial [Rubellimicrobium sp.]|nr:chemotaxis protein CheW [Rubellimicrobium sp.]
VREILILPEGIASLPRSGGSVLGVTTLRGRLLPILSGRALLGLPAAEAHAPRPSVLVTSIGGALAGIAVDRTTAIFRLTAEQVDPVPAVLVRGTRGEAEVQSIARIEGGRRLVAVLSAERLLRDEALARITTNRKEQPVTQAQDVREPIAIFTLADADYGLPVATVEEVARMPETLSRLPHAPRFVEGLINLRGQALPVIDLRRRLDLPPRPRTGRERILVIAIDGARTGFLVDTVKEIARLPASSIESAPELAEGQSSVVTRVANLAETGRMILLLDPARLLNGGEVQALARIGHRTEPLAP